VVSAWLSAEQPGSTPYVGVHQRLDRDTSGVVVFARSERANPGLADAFSGRHVTKTYHALCVAPLRRPDAARPRLLKHRLSAVGTGRSARMTPSPVGVLAETAVSIVERLGPVVLVEATPRTGRRHQVRAHLAADGLPIVGDVRYGGAGTWPCPVPRALLHAYSIALPHPISGRPLLIVCPWPDDFQRAVECFRAGPDDRFTAFLARGTKRSPK
jgi:23S rRNA-/tRNA-specific pseudouridylate synthase